MNSSDTGRTEPAAPDPDEGHATETPPVRSVPDMESTGAPKDSVTRPDTGDTEDGQPATGDAADTRDTVDTADAADRYHADETEAPRPRAALIATAVALPVALIVGVLVAAILARQHTTHGPLALGSVAAPGATGPACTALLPALPTRLGEYDRAELAKPAPTATAAWQPADGSDPIVLRCGLDRPQEFTKASALQVVNGVNWFEVRDQTSGTTSGTWFAVDRGTYIAVTTPDKAGPTPLQDLSDTMSRTLPTQPIDPGPVPG